VLVLLTQPERRSRRHAEALARDGIRALIWPLMKVVPTTDAAPNLDGIDALLATSSNAVAVFADLSPRRDLPILCVGDTTGRAAREAGFGDVSAAEGAVADLAERARLSGHERLLYLRARDVSADLGAAVGSERVGEAVLYETVPTGSPSPAVEEALRAGRVDLVTIWSARNAETLADHASRRADWPLEGMDLLSISEKAAQPLSGAGFRRTLWPPTPGTAGMFDAIRAAARQ